MLAAWHILGYIIVDNDGYAVFPDCYKWRNLYFKCRVAAFVFTRFFSTGGNVRWVIVLAAVLLCCCLTVNAVLLAGLLGAYVRVWTAVRRRMISKSGPGPGDNGGGNSDRDPF